MIGNGKHSGKTFVGFGFGPIQSGLFVYEALRSGRFNRIVIAEVDRELVRALRQSGGFYDINVAHRDRVSSDRVGPAELLDPTDEDDARRLVEAIAEADELATALPSVAFYVAGGAASVAELLADGFSRKAPEHMQIVYTAENDNRAAELLETEVRRASGDRLPPTVQFLNTVIGKISGVIDDRKEQEHLGLTPLTPGFQRAVLVEEFNRVLISRIELAGYRRGLEIFEEKDELRPFEEAKLYGHNAIHALLGYLANERGYASIAEAGNDAVLMTTVREAFLFESGAGLRHRHAGCDPLFTPEGFEVFADDLLARMCNPWLHDTVARVIRDPARKLRWDDRLIGAMRLALEAGVQPFRLAEGVRAAMRFWLLDGWPEDVRQGRDARSILALLARA